MQYDVKTPRQYLDILEKDWRKDKLQEIRDMILQQGPELTEGIQYKMLSYAYKNNVVFSLNAQANYVSLYVGNIDKVKDSKALLDGFNRGKGCVRVKKTIDLSASGLEQFIENTLEVWRQGGETDC